MFIDLVMRSAAVGSPRVLRAHCEGVVFSLMVEPCSAWRSVWLEDKREAVISVSAE